jgi:hypothetical protein
VRAAAEWVAGFASSSGLQEVKIHDTPGHPIVTAEWIKADKPKQSTILIYGH